MVTIKIKENSKQAKAIIEMLRTFPFVEFEEKKQYDSFVAKVKNAQKEKGKTFKNATELWKSIN